MSKRAGSDHSSNERKDGGRKNSSPTPEPERNSHFERKLHLPFDGELTRASASIPRRPETIVFVHHFAGSKRTLLRHLKFVNSLGFDAVRFNLLMNEPVPAATLPITAQLKFGTRHVWAEQIEAVLNAVPGPKIVYSFSMPSNSALMAIAQRHAEDIVGWICDGGPFLELPKCTWNLYEHQYKVSSKLLRGVYTGISLALYGAGLPEEIPQLLKRLPSGFPVLSIRGLKDPLVPTTAIDEILLQREDLHLEVLSLPDGKHLDGLKNFEAEYRNRATRFLDSISGT